MLSKSNLKKLKPLAKRFGIMLNPVKVVTPHHYNLANVKVQSGTKPTTGNSKRKLNTIHDVIPKALTNKEKGLNKAGKPLARVAKKPRM
jgi:hypothetical protein